MPGLDGADQLRSTAWYSVPVCAVRLWPVGGLNMGVVRR